MKKDIEKVIIVDRLTKNFEVVEKEKGLIGSVKRLFSPKKKIIKALKGISLSLEEGELVGFIGPNGAGKTTTLKILSGLLYPTSGFVQVLGYNPWERKAEFLKSISLVMGQKNQLWWDLPAIETLELNKAIYEIPTKEYQETLDNLVSLLEVEKILKIPVRHLSLGQRMRLELLAALIHNPKILFLDEPSIGLDVVAQQEVRDFIFEYNRLNKATILLTSHNMGDLVNLVKRVIVIDKGEIFFDGELNNLVEKFAKERVINVYFTKDVDFKKLGEIGKVQSFDYPKASILVPREASSVAAAELLQNFPVADLTIEEEPIEKVIRRVFKRKLLGHRTRI